MNDLEKKALDILLPAAAYLLGVLFPGIPSFIWEGLFAGIQDGDLTAEHIEDFMKDHGIRTYQEYPVGKNGQSEG